MYTEWIPTREDEALFKIFELSEYNTVYVSPCGNRICSACYADRTLHRICPACGSELTSGTGNPYRCACGITMWACGTGCNKVVTAYAAPNPIFYTEEDMV